MVDKNIKLKNILNIWFQVLCYSLLFTALFFIFMPESRGIKNLIASVLPVVGKQWWYVSAYFALFLFIPVLNKAIENISRQTYRSFLIIILLLVCCLDKIIPVDAFTLNGGYSAIWLIIVYLFGAYIKKYDLNKRITALKSAGGFLAMVILTFAGKMGTHFLTELIFGRAKFEDVLVSYTSITILLSAIFLFLLCLNLKINHSVSKIICFFSPATLGVYLIHVHPFVFEYIVKDAFAPLAYKAPVTMLLHVLAATLVIFIFCAIVDLLRIQLFKLVRINRLCDAIENKINAFNLKVFKK